MANRVNNATSSLNTGKSALRRRSARAAARPRDMLAREIGQLEGMLPSHRQLVLISKNLCRRRYLVHVMVDFFGARNAEGSVTI